jgi:predicted nucleic acid-binding Zn ribbon protein
MRSKLLAEWRGFDEVADTNSRVHHASSFIDAILKSAGLTDGIHEHELQAAWREIAGDFIAGHTHPSSVKGGTLVLRVTQPSMRFQLEQMKPALLKRIQECQGTSRIRAIRFAIG